MKYKTFMPEAKVDFNQTQYVAAAIKWLEKKFKGQGFKFKHRPKLANPTKTYQVAVGAKEFDIGGRLMDTNSDGTADTVLFRIYPVDEQDDKTDTF